MHFIFLQGLLGSGKTTNSVIFSYLIKSLFERKNGQELTLFSNFRMAGSTTMTSYEQWYDVARSHASLCIWDEAHRLFDSRKANTNDSVFASHFFTYVRKMNSVQFFTSPSIERVDVRVRELTEILIDVHRVNDDGIYLKLYDYQAQHFGEKGLLRRVLKIDQAKLNKIFKINLFDTDDIISVFPMPNKNESDTFFLELENIQRSKSDQKNRELGNYADFVELLQN